ncbi:Rha family transcriptional regulator [Bacillus sp. BGMRC 2118]|nr:Rha family transcriptional regulator [Bacillus sp. BGMRC 2118]
MELKVINQDGQLLVDSREVAEMVAKQHKDLLETIRGYIEHLISGKFRPTDFFILSNYQDSLNRTKPRYLITRKGCDMVANKMTGEKGVLFTATYVTRFEEMENQLKEGPKSEIELIAMIAQKMVEKERRDKERDEKLVAIEQGVNTLTTGLTAVPDHKKVVDTVNEYARYARLGHDEVYKHIYSIMKAQHGIDIPARVENERRKVNAAYFEKKGKLYAESTLKSKVNGIDVMVRLGVLDKFNRILIGLLAKAKGIPS